MSKELIEQLAKEHLKPAQILEYGAYTLTDEQLLRICKAYQAAAPIDTLKPIREAWAVYYDGSEGLPADYMRPTAVYDSEEIAQDYCYRAAYKPVKVYLYTAAPIDNVAEALQEIFDLCMKYQRSCYNTGYLHLADALLNIASKANTSIRAIPDTQAKEGE